MENSIIESGKKYRKGLVSLAEAATLARVSIYDMMDYIQREKIQPAELSDQELKENLADADRIFNTTMNKHKSNKK